MTFAFVDLQFPGKKANREHTGGFGSQMKASGLMGRIVTSRKQSLIHLPITSFGYAAALLRNAGHEVHYYGGPTKGEDIILIASSMHCYRDELNFIREEKRRHPQSRIGVFGPFAMTRPEFFEPDCHFLIFGELETSIFAFLDGRQSFSGRMNYGVVDEMDRLPIPDWRGLDVRKSSYFPLLHLRPVLTIQATRGCSFNCDFCPYMVVQTPKFRTRMVDRVVDEMEHGIAQHGARSFLFRDICFTLNKKYTSVLCNVMRKRRLAVEWACETRTDCLTTELIDEMFEAGLRGINLGIETGNIEVLEDSGKLPTDLKFQERVIRHLQKRGIRINGFYMLGLIGDTVGSMQQTLQYAISLNTTGAQFCTMTPFPGTKLYEDSKGSLLTDDYSQYTEYEPVVDISTATPTEVRLAAATAYRKYYLRWAWWREHGLSVSLRFLRNCV